MMISEYETFIKEHQQVYLDYCTNTLLAPYPALEATFSCKLIQLIYVMIPTFLFFSSCTWIWT
jgi:hypothetical protein